MKRGPKNLKIVTDILLSRYPHLFDARDQQQMLNNELMIQRNYVRLTKNLDLAVVIPELSTRHVFEKHSINHLNGTAGIHLLLQKVTKLPPKLFQCFVEVIDQCFPNMLQKGTYSRPTLFPCNCWI